MSWLEQLRERLEDPWDPMRGPRAAITGVVVLLFIVVTWASGGYIRILDDANLAFHEAGHLIYGVLGATAMLYGGTLGQLTFPLVVLVSFFVRRQVLGVVVGACWCGENLINIARYCADARAQVLPLVGGDEHDWLHILSRWGVLHRDTQIASIIRTTGWACIAAAVVFVVLRWWRDRDRPVEVREQFFG